LVYFLHSKFAHMPLYALKSFLPVVNISYFAE